MYDLIIIGGGAAGLGAAIYSARYKLKTLVLAKEIGGQINESPEVENYPGFIKIPGMELLQKFKEQAVSLGVEVVDAEVTDIKKGKTFKVNNKYEAKSIIFAMGSYRRELNIPGEKEYKGKGVSYCATCDAPFFKGKIVGVIGGNDSAVQAALLAAKYAKKVFIIYRKEKVRAEPIWIERMEKTKNIQVINNTNVTEFKGEKFLTKVILDKAYKGSKEFKLDGVFVEIGAIPASQLAKKLGVKLDKKAHIVVSQAMETNIKGIFAAGDITTGSNMFQQVITAASEGSIAADSVYGYLQGK